MSRKIKKILVSTFVVYFCLIMFFAFFEPEISQAAAGTTDVYLDVITEITLSCDASTTLAGTINSMSGGTATNTFACTITSPNDSGYNMTVVEDHTLQIAATPDNEFQNASTSSPLAYDWVAPGAGVEIFGFSMATGTVQAAAAYRNGGGVCNSGTNVDGVHCWNGFTTSTQKVVSSSVPSASAGDAAVFMLKAQAGTSNFLTNGTYHNVITLTATVGP